MGLNPTENLIVFKRISSGKSVTNNNSCLFSMALLIQYSREPTFHWQQVLVVLTSDPKDHIKNFWSCIPVIGLTRKETFNPLWIHLWWMLTPVKSELMQWDVKIWANWPIVIANTSSEPTYGFIQSQEHRQGTIRLHRGLFVKTTDNTIKVQMRHLHILGSWTDLPYLMIPA